MSRLVLPFDMLNKLRTLLFRDENEACAILFGRPIYKGGKLLRIVVQELLEPEKSSYDLRTTTSVQLSSEFIATISQRSRKSGESIIFVHSHPFALNKFSYVDDVGESMLSSFFKQRTPNTLHASLLLTPEKCLARILGEELYLTVIGVGPNIFIDNYNSSSVSSQTYDRQVRAFGKQGQQILESLKIGIVGLGGTGSIVAQQLAHLGVQNFMLIDPDTIEESNLNRVVGASKEDLGEYKVNVTKELITCINSNANVEVIPESILKNRIAESLIDTDFAFSCTDSHGSRAILNQLAYQYLLPVIDMGVVITVEGQRVNNIAGRTQLLSPGLACMICGNLLDYEEIRRDLLSDFERKLDPYIMEQAEPAPAVISLNSTIASMAITMFLNSVLGIPGNARFINYNAISGVTRSATCSRHPTCVVCSINGSYLKADEWQLPGRID